MPKQKSTEETAAENPDVTIVRTIVAEKMSPRGAGRVSAQVGRVGNKVVVRLSHNESSGHFSHEWVGFAALRSVLEAAVRCSMPFKASLLDSCFKSRSNNNAGFMTCALRADGLLAAHDEHPNMSVVSGDLDAWERAALEGPPALVDGRPETAPLYPPPPENRFKKKVKDGGGDADAPETGSAKPPKKGHHKVRGMEGSGELAHSDASSAEGERPAEDTEV